MNIQPLPKRGHDVNPLSRELDALICSVGLPQFEQTLFDTARAATGCEHLTAYAVSPEGRPRMLLAANVGAAPVAREAGRTYVSKFWEADPVNSLARGDDLATGVVVRAGADEIRAAAFREHCYSARAWSASGVQMIERVSILQRRGDETVKISFHRSSADGPFSDQQVRNVAAASETLVPLVCRHGASGQPLAQSTTLQTYVEAVQAAAPDLSHREAEICAAIVLGMSTEGIALSLDISQNTVRTYRKRSYSRLGICSQNELMRLVLPHFMSANGPEARRTYMAA